MTDEMEGTEVLYKALKADGTSTYQGYEWPLPTKNGDGWEPGEWVEAGEGDLVACEHGIHACMIDQLPIWLDATLYVLQPAPGTDRLDGDDKVVLRRARLTRRVETWTETTARLFAADCAEMVLPIYEREYPDDDRPRLAIAAARAYAHGEIDSGALVTARDAAWSAARSAAWSAEWSAARHAARHAAWAAARSVAGRVRWSATWAALSDRLALYLERGESAADVPLPEKPANANK